MRATTWLLTATALSTSLFVAESAFAGTDACGGFAFSANSTCEIKLAGGCTASCTDLTVDTQCHGELSISCDTQCNKLPMVDCTASCQTDCSASCQADANFSCNADCKASCDADCAGNCSASANQAQCQASCKASCSSNCEGSCEGQASASCEGKCEGSCEGQCTVDANIECQTDCQSKGYAECVTKVKGGCVAACTEPTGALFCDGQYVDVDDLDDCLAQLVAEWDIKADGYAYGNCENGTCSGEAGGSVSCSTTAIGSGDYALGVFGVLGLVGLGLGISRRRIMKHDA